MTPESNELEKRIDPGCATLTRMTNYMLRKTLFTSSGQSLVELLITIGMAAILMPAFLVGFSTTRSGRAQQEERIQATAYLKEAEEAVRQIRDNGWGYVATNGTYCPQMVSGGTTWELKSFPQNSICDTPDTGFTRKIIIADAYRNDTTHAIDLVGGAGTSLDPSTKTITISVSWNNPISSSVSHVLYLTRHDNLSFLDSKYADFTAGTKSSTAVTNIIDGEVELGGSGASDWCNPNGAGIIKYNLSGNGQWTAISAVAPDGATAGHAYTTFGFNQSGNPLDSVNITDAATPVVSAGNSFTADQVKTYALYADPSTNYVYVTSNSNKYQVIVINTTDFSQHAATFNSSGGEAGYSVFVTTIGGNKVGFVTAADTTHNVYKLYSFSVGNTPSGALTQLGSVTLAGTGYKVTVVGNYAFIATSSSSSPLQIVNVSNPASMSVVDSFSVSSYQGASPQPGVKLNVDSSGQYVFLATNYVDSTHPDIFMINVTTPTAPVVVGTANTYQNSVGMNPTGIIPVSGNHMIVVGSGGQEYQVFYTYPAVKYCGGMTLASPGTKINAVAGVSENDGDNFAYILTDDSSGWFQIVPGGAGAGGGGGGGGSGSFISEGIPMPNLTTAATFNHFYPVADVPSPTTLTYQVSVASTCSGPFTFIGPDGTSGTTFATSSAIPLTGASGYTNPGGCFKYKAIFNANGSNTLTPILYQVTVNYSP